MTRDRCLFLWGGLWALYLSLLPLNAEAFLRKTLGGAITDAAPPVIHTAELAVDRLLHQVDGVLQRRIDQVGGEIKGVLGGNAQDFVKGVLGGDVKGVLGGLLGKDVNGIIQSTLSQADKIAARQIANVNATLEQRILQVNGVLKHRFAQLDDIAKKRLTQIDQTIQTTLQRVDQVLDQRLQQVDGLVQNSVNAVNQVAQQRIRQVDEAVEKRLGNVNTILSQTSISIEEAMISAVRGIGAMVLLALFLALSYLQYRKIFINPDDSSPFTWAQFWSHCWEVLKTMWWRVLLLAAAGVGVAMLFFSISRVFFHDVKERRSQLTQKVSQSYHSSVAAFDLKMVRYFASQLRLLNPDHTQARGIELKARLMRDMFSNQGAYRQRDRVNQYLQRIEQIEKYLQETTKQGQIFSDPDIDVMRAYIYWRAGEDRCSEWLAALLSARSLLRMERWLGYKHAPPARKAPKKKSTTKGKANDQSKKAPSTSKSKKHPIDIKLNIKELKGVFKQRKSARLDPEKSSTFLLISLAVNMLQSYLERPLPSSKDFKARCLGQTWARNFARDWNSKRLRTLLQRAKGSKQAKSGYEKRCLLLGMRCQPIVRLDQWYARKSRPSMLAMRIFNGKLYEVSSRAVKGYLKMLYAHSQSKNADYSKRLAAAKDVLKAWRDFDAYLRRPEVSNSTMPLAAFSLNDVLPARARWFVLHVTSRDLPPRFFAPSEPQRWSSFSPLLTGESLTRLDRLRMAPYRILWKNRYLTQLSRKTRMLFERHLSDQFKRYEEDVVAFERDFSSCLSADGVKKERSGRLIATAAKLGWYVTTSKKIFEMAGKCFGSSKPTTKGPKKTELNVRTSFAEVLFKRWIQKTSKSKASKAKVEKDMLEALLQRHLTPL